MQFNKKLINDLREGRIVLHNDPKNPEAVKEIIKEAKIDTKRNIVTGQAKRYWVDEYGQYGPLNFTEELSAPHLPHFLVADFLLPEPKFKVGDKVVSKPFSHTSVLFTKAMEKYVGTEGVITESIRSAFHGGICYEVFGYFWPESALELANVSSPTATPKFKVGDRVIHKKSTGNNSFIVHHINWCNDLKDFCCYPEKGIGIAEFALVLAPDPQFEIGKTYEFGYAGSWFKGVLLAIHKDKYIADTSNGTNIQVDVYPRIRPIQPKPVKVERWANVYPDGGVSGWLYTSEAEAKKQGNSVCKQVKLEGTYYADPD